MSAFGSFGIANERMWVRPGRTLGILIGDFSTGKTTFLGSNPGALIVNLDRSSTPVPTATSPGLRAQMWPGLNPEGQTIGPDRVPFILTWDKVVELGEKLVKAAKDNLPRPETLVLDSSTEMFNLLREASLRHFKKDAWDEGHGPSMWEWVYQQYSTFVQSMRGAGYGVWVTAHISPEYITEDDGKRKTRWSLNTPPGFFRRFYGLFEMALEMQKVITPTAVKVPRNLIVDGKPVVIEDVKTENVTSFLLVGENPERTGLYKRRVCFPAQIPLPATNGWEVFEKVYLEVAKPPTT